ncbi:MSP domain protein [Cooperia oncophora]
MVCLILSLTSTIDSSVQINCMDVRSNIELSWDIQVLWASLAILITSFLTMACGKKAPETTHVAQSSSSSSVEHGSSSSSGDGEYEDVDLVEARAPTMKPGMLDDPEIKTVLPALPGDDHMVDPLGEAEKQVIDAASKESIGLLLKVEPPKAIFKTSGGLSKHTVTNKGQKRVVFKIKCSNNNDYGIHPVFGFIEPMSPTTVMITRLPGVPKQDKIVIQWVDAPATAKDPREAFKAASPWTLQAIKIFMEITADTAAAATPPAPAAAKPSVPAVLVSAEPVPAKAPVPAAAPAKPPLPAAPPAAAKPPVQVKPAPPPAPKPSAPALSTPAPPPASLKAPAPKPPVPTPSIPAPAVAPTKPMGFNAPPPRPAPGVPSPKHPAQTTPPPASLKAAPPQPLVPAFPPKGPTPGVAKPPPPAAFPKYPVPKGPPPAPPKGMGGGEGGPVMSVYALGGPAAQGSNAPRSFAAQPPREK